MKGVLSVLLCQCCHNPGGSNNRNLFSHSSRGWKSKIKVLSAGLVSPEASFLDLQMTVVSLCPHMVISLPVCVLISSYKDIRSIGLGPI